MLKLKINEAIATSAVLYDKVHGVIKFGDFTIGGVRVETDEELAEVIEICCYREDFGGRRFFEN